MQESVTSLRATAADHSKKAMTREEKEFFVNLHQKFDKVEAIWAIVFRLSYPMVAEAT